MEIPLAIGTYNYTVSNSIGFFTDTPGGTVQQTAAGQTVTTNYLGKFTITKYLNMENGNVLNSSSGLSSAQTVFPVYGVFDNFTHVFLVAGYSTSTIYEVSPVNYTIVGEIHLPDAPLAVTVNPANGQFYVANSSALLKYSPGGTLLDTHILTSTPSSLIYDPGNSQVLVSGSDGGVLAFNSSDLAVVASLPSISQFDLQGFAYNYALGQMEIVDNSASAGRVVFLNSNDSIATEMQVPGTILSLVYDSSLNISLITSIPANTPWAYIISGNSVTKVSGSANAYGLGINYGTGMGVATNMQNSSVMLFNLTTGNVVYVINTGGTPLMPLTLPGSAGMLVIDPNNDALDIIPLSYGVRNVVFNEQGISPLQKWGVTVDSYTISSTSHSILYFESSGNYTYTPSQVPGYSVQQGTFTVSGKAVSIDVQYNRTYDVMFHEAGLNPGTLWGATLNGETMSSASSSNITFLETNGTYSFNITGVQNYAVTPQNGLISISGSAIVIDLNFSMTSYIVNFTSTGLPSNDHWNLMLNGIQHPVDGLNYSFIATPGTYSYSIRPIAGYYPQISSGSFSVSTSNVTIDVAWEPYLYKVNFTQDMLPNGTIWTVDLGNNSTLSSNGTSGTAYLPNGTYSYSFSSSNSSWKGFHGFMSVQGNAISVPLNFTEIIYSVSFVGSGLPAGTDWTVSINSLTQGTIYSNVTFRLPNGTYTYSAVPGNNSYSSLSGLLVVNGSSATKLINFYLRDANVTFHETGLPAGAQWGVGIPAMGDYNSTGSNLTLSLPFGVYSYVPLAVPGYTASNVSIMFSLGIGFQNVTLDVNYTKLPAPSKQLYNVTIMEVGLPEYLNWAATYNDTIIPAYPGGVFQFSLANGTYNFTFMALNHLGQELPGAFTATLHVNGTSHDLLVLFYGPYVWMIFDFPYFGNGHADHHDHDNQNNGQHFHDNVAETARMSKKTF